MRRHLLLLILGMLTGLFLLFFLLQSEGMSDAFHPAAIVGATLFGWLLAYAVYALSKTLDRLLLWGEHAGWRWLAGLATNTLLVYGMSFLALRIYKFWLSDLPANFIDSPQLFLRMGILLLFLVLIYTVLYFALYSVHRYGQLKLAHVQHEREQIDLQWNALRNQLQPHFLYNSLNTISALIYRDVEQAETFIRRLADTYRYPLSRYDHPLVKLQEELDFVMAYHYLLQTRFGENLRLIIDVPEVARQSKVPPLSLQLLLENAVKHNQISAEEPLEIHLTADDEWLSVSNNITDRPDKIASFSIGLDNIRARYGLLTKKNIEVKQGKSFLVKIPLIV